MDNYSKISGKRQPLRVYKKWNIFYILLQW